MIVSFAPVAPVINGVVIVKLPEVASVAAPAIGFPDESAAFDGVAFSKTPPDAFRLTPA